MIELAEIFAEAAIEAGLDRDQQAHIARKLAQWISVQADDSVGISIVGFDPDEFEETAISR